MSLRVGIAAMIGIGLPLLAACQPTSNTVSAIERSPAGLDQVPLTVTTTSGKVHRFTVEVTRTPDEQQQGMMHRQSLAPDRGMLFPFEAPRQASFWMQNTLISLDLIFFRSDGTISNIEANAVPLSPELIHSAGPVAGVLEIAGGRAAELGFKAGDRVEWLR